MAEIGWVNKAFDITSEMEAYVDAMVAKIALFPRNAVVATKKGIREEFGQRKKALANDITRFGELSGMNSAQGLVDRWLELSDNPSRGPFEVNKDEDLVHFLCVKLNVALC
jgi:enoyl-CoA hydratase/carnithine racemase